MPRERYQSIPEPFPQPDPLEVEAQRIRDTTRTGTTTDNPRESKRLNSDPDGYVPGRINQAECVERLRAAGLLNIDPTHAACGSPLAEKILRAALALDSQVPIPHDLLGVLYLAVMHEDLIDGSKILLNAVVGFANRNRVTLPTPGAGTNGHKCSFQEEMRRRCA